MLFTKLIKTFLFAELFVSAQTIVFQTFTIDLYLNDKACNHSDIVFQGNSVSLSHCAFTCDRISECVGFTYNIITITCVCCTGVYNNQTMLPTQSENKYFKRQDEWIYFEGNFYSYSDTLMNFDQATAYCTGLGGFVARIDSEEKIAFLSGLGVETSNFWIGLTDEGHEGVWKWVNDDSVVNETFWRDSKDPAVDDTFNCVSTSRNSNYYWIDRRCRDSFWALCEKMQ